MHAVFPPGAVVRRVNREPAILFGAGRALLLQLAHPAVAQGVADHSEFTVNPFTRLQGTLEAVNAAVFGSDELADRVGRRIHWVHDFVTGTGYRANDPENLLWVHATLADTALSCYERLVGPLTPDEAARYYEEMTRVAEVFGLDRADQPADLAEFRAYVDRMVSSLEVTETARELASFILRPRLPQRLDVPHGPLLDLQRLHAVGSLPPRLRAGYGLRWGDAHQRRYDASCRHLRAVNRRTPALVRTAPTALHSRLLLRRAERSVAAFERRRAAA